MKESILYQKLTEERKVQCNTCNHRCIIKVGEKGLCQVRKNISGILYAINYERTISIAIDPIEKKPLYHFMPGTKTYSLATIGCNLKCLWCQNWQISQLQNNKQFDEDIPGEIISAKEHVLSAIEHKCPSISYTYTEPTIFLEYALDIMKLAKEKGLKNIWVSNGYMTTEALDLINPYLDAINVDLKAWDNDKSIKYCGAKVQPILDNIKYLKNKKIHQEITTLIVPGVNDDIEQLTNIANFIAGISKEIPWHINRFYPAWKMMDTPITPVEIMKKAEEIGIKAGLKNIHLGNL
ncbi:MAG: AmmeMemoRadiSam system radical SAM enzyme [Firmicutes bacterium]|nr:AmmeMemoRadiSam system radical SAM enzyme [Bacillota bacterium]